MSDPQQPIQPQHPQYSPTQPVQPPVQPVQPQPMPQYAPPPAGYAPPYGATQYAIPYGYVIPSGRKFWALSFLLFIPYVGWIVSLIVSLVQNSSARHDPNPVVRENARWAANWMLTVVVMGAVGVALIVGAGMAGAATDSAGGDGDVWLPVAVLGLLLWSAVGVAHLVICIVGTVQADRRVFNPRVAIPFIRPIA